MVVVSGMLWKVLDKYDILTIDRKQLHHIEGVTTADILEISTHHRDEDSYRIDSSCRTKGEK